MGQPSRRTINFIREGVTLFFFLLLLAGVATAVNYSVAAIVGGGIGFAVCIYGLMRG